MSDNIIAAFNIAVILGIGVAIGVAGARYDTDDCPFVPYNRATQAGEFVGGHCTDAGSKEGVDFSFCSFPDPLGGPSQRGYCGMLPGEGLKCINPVWELNHPTQVEKP